jgi:hypothetical protein
MNWTTNLSLFQIHRKEAIPALCAVSSVVSEVAQPGNVQASRRPHLVDGDMFSNLHNWKFNERDVGHLSDRAPDYPGQVLCCGPTADTPTSCVVFEPWR